MTPDHASEMRSTALQEVGQLRPIVATQLHQLGAAEVSFGQFVDYLRQRIKLAHQAGLTLDEIAVELQVAKDFVSHIVNSDEVPSLTLGWISRPASRPAQPGQTLPAAGTRPV